MSLPVSRSRRWSSGKVVGGCPPSVSHKKVGGGGFFIRFKFRDRIVSLEFE